MRRRASAPQGQAPGAAGHDPGRRGGLPAAGAPAPAARRLDASAAVLAGGTSRRMGRDKARLLIEGRTLLERRVTAVAALFEEVLVIAPAGHALRGQALGAARVVADAHPHAGPRPAPDAAAGGADRLGPLAGVVGALRAARNPRVLVTACDMPHLVPGLVRRLVERAGEAQVQVALCRSPSGRGVEPLLGVYTQAALPALEAALAAGVRRLQDAALALEAAVLDDAEVRALDPGGLSFVNWNEPGDLPPGLSGAGGGAPAVEDAP